MKTKIVIDLLRYWGNHCDAHISNGEYQVEGSVLLKSAALKMERLCDDVSERNEKIGKLKKNNRELRKDLAEREAAPGWISVEERLPEESGYYLAYDCRGNLFICLYQANGLWDSSSVDYWMPLPEPPKPKAKTYKDVFFDIFPDGDMDAVQSRLCINIFFPLFDRPERCVDCEDCWNQPYPEEEGGAE